MLTLSPTPSIAAVPLRTIVHGGTGSDLLRSRRHAGPIRLRPVNSPPLEPAPVDDRQVRDQRLCAWLQRAAHGDAQAFERFYDATVGYAQALARRMLAAHDLDDALSEAYFQAWREAPRFDAGRGSPVTWLLTIVRSRALDLLRRQRATHECEAGEALDERPADAPGPQELLATLEDGCALHAALSALSAQERWLLGLAYFRELTHAQIALVTGLPLGTVKSSILRAQGKLRQLMP
jgi:RNA polymerase sigma-70 factor (ECF subfamily)